MPVGEDWEAALNDVRAVIQDAKASPASEAEIDREYREFEALMAFAVENKDTEAGSKQADDIVGAVDIRETVASPETALKIFRDMKPGLTPEVAGVHRSEERRVGKGCGSTCRTRW